MKLKSLASEFVVWRDGTARWKEEGKYKASAVWSSIRPKHEKVSWNKLVWSSLNVPKHSFISWMAILNRLSTRDKMREWGIVIDGKCELCHNEMESRNHIFFRCSFSQEVWREVLRMGGLNRRVMKWEQELEWARKRLKGKALISVLLRAV